MGTSPIGNQPRTYGYSVEEALALQTLRRVFTGPLTFVDTSNGYGLSEHRIGSVLREFGGVPSGFVLATKVDPDASGDFSGRRVYASVAESRQRLGLDHLPLVYLHDPERIDFDDSLARDGAVEALRQLKVDGIVGHVGVAGGPIEMMRRYVATGVFDVALTHNRFTLLDQSALPLFDDCAANGVAVVNAAPFASGLLAKGPDQTDRYVYRPAPAEIVTKARLIQNLCREHEVPLAAAALQFSLREPRISSTVVGMTRPERVDQTVRLVEQVIPNELWRELETVIGWSSADTASSIVSVIPHTTVESTATEGLP